MPSKKYTPRPAEILEDIRYGWSSKKDPWCFVTRRQAWTVLGSQYLEIFASWDRLSAEKLTFSLIVENAEVKEAADK